MAVLLFCIIFKFPRRIYLDIVIILAIMKTLPCSASKQLQAILLSKTSQAREFNECYCVTIALAVESERIPRVMDRFLIISLVTMPLNGSEETNLDSVLLHE